MLCDPATRKLSEFDQQVFRIFVPPTHPLCRALEAIPWDSFHDELAQYYCPNQGQPARPPVMMLKLEFLSYLFRLSDRQVVARAETDLAFRYFLQMRYQEPVPDPSSLSYFRGRVGVEGFRGIFRRVVAVAREQGLVKDRLRIKDATHVIADIAIPTTLKLVAQARDKLLAAAETFDALRVEGERVQVELLRDSTGSCGADERLVARVTHLREILAWADQLDPPPDADANPPWQTLVRQRQLAHRILADQADPQAGDRIRSTADPDARRSKHGEWYDGYLVDFLVDADSEIITEINVLPANGDEARDALALVRQEEAAQGNDIQALSIDGAGFNGALLRELQDPAGLNIETFVPPRAEPVRDTFTPADFQANTEQTAVTCPAGQTSHYRQRNERNTGWTYRFQRATCAACSLVSRCVGHPLSGVFGRTVVKNGYQAELDRVRQKATTATYFAVRSEHPKVERKLGEVMNRHGGRRARYRGCWKVLIHELLACTVTNVKRIVRLQCARSPVRTAGY